MTLVQLATVATLATLVACGGSSSPTGTKPPAGATTVTIQDFHYSPANVTISAGHTVFWMNNGPSAHTTTSDTGVWDSGTLGAPTGGGPYGGGTAGGTFEMTFNTPGTYPFHCKLHPPSLYPAFVGTITVTQ
jgi:plastocyanin